MADKQRMPMRSDTPEFHQGYLDGRRSAFDDAELDAYYAGVGYGKKTANTKHMGFTNDEERRQFEMGISNSHKHFRAYRTEPLSFWERLFGKKKSRTDQINVRDRRSVADRKVKKALSDRQRKKRKSNKAGRKAGRRINRIAKKEFRRYTRKKILKTKEKNHA